MLNFSPHTLCLRCFILGPGRFWSKLQPHISVQRTEARPTPAPIPTTGLQGETGHSSFTSHFIITGLLGPSFSSFIPTITVFVENVSCGKTPGWKLKKSQVHVQFSIAFLGSSHQGVHILYPPIWAFVLFSSHRCKKNEKPGISAYCKKVRSRKDTVAGMVEASWPCFQKGMEFWLFR